MTKMTGQSQNAVHAYKTRPLIGSLRSTALFYSVMSLSLLMCIRQWGQNDPWSRLDGFVCLHILVTTLLLIHSLVYFNQVVYRSTEVEREAFGMNYDPKMALIGMVLGAAEAIVFLDYGQWHFAPALESSPLRTIGVIVLIIAVVWRIWTDNYLTRHFSHDLTERELMTQGPYQVIRHPRYAGFLLSKVALALLYASIIGWVLVIGSILLIIRRINREEEHLRQVFGTKYGDYAQRTDRMFPRIY